MSKYLDNNGLLYLWQKIKTLLAGKVDAVSGKGLSTNDFTDALKTKLDGIAAGANAYTHPSYTSKTSGLYKITVDGTGHVSGATAVAKSDITALGIPEQDTQYTHPSYTARTGKPTANQTPGFGSTFTISQITSDATGHVTAATDRTVKIPNATASGSANGLMTSAHYTKLEALPDNATLQSTYALKSDITSMYRHKGSVATVADLPASGNTAGDVYNVTATGMNYVWVDATTGWDALGEVFSIESITNSEIDTILAS